MTISNKNLQEYLQRRSEFRRKLQDIKSKAIKSLQDKSDEEKRKSKEQYGKRGLKII